MTNLQANQPFPTITQYVQRTVYPILLATSFAHLLNDTMQAVIAAIYLSAVGDQFYKITATK